ncbi:MAG: AAA family ATPase [Anaerolineae bacterium]
MILLPKLSIKNYRLFQDFKIERLAQVNLVAGRNNVGKSALLEAAYLVGTQNPRDALLQVLAGRGERTGERWGWMLSPLFFNYQLSQDSSIEINAGNRRIKIYVLNREEWSTVAERFPRLESIADLAAFPLRIEHSAESKPIDLLSTEGTTRDLRQPIPPWRREPDPACLIRGTDSLYSRYRELSAWWDEIALTPRSNVVMEILRIIEPKLQNLDFLSQQDNVKVLLEGVENPVFMGSLGDGMHHLLVIAIALASAQGGLLLLDEVETGLHYSVLVNLWHLLFQTARKLNVQVIATTHSWDCIAAFSRVWNEIQETEGQYCRLDRVGEQIVAEFYSPDELALAVERGIETR